MNLETIHQTKIWAEFRLASKKEKYFEIDCGKAGSVYVQKMPLPRGMCWLYCNRGPAFKDFSEQIVGEFLNKIREIAKKENAVFLRIEPPFEKNTDEGKEYEKMISKTGFKKAHASHQPECTLVLDLARSIEQILAGMKQKGRYNIKIAEKRGVKIHESKDVESYYKILEQTLARDKFSGHEKDFYKKMIEILGPQHHAKMYLAEYEKEIIAGMILTYYKDTAIYYYGASSNKYREVMAPYLLQWTAIKDAKERGFKYYDFLGIAPPEAKNHPWAGVTDFKLKFGGRTVEYVKAREFVFKPFWYWIIRIVKRIKGV
jgi:peptidoglycan pentaglycine glycine transferase (the first glycine)